MNENVIPLVQPKSDVDIAKELREELFISAQAYLETCTKAYKLGFHVSSQFAINPFGQCVIVNLSLFKSF